MERYKIVIEKPAVLDLDNIYDYLKNELQEPKLAERIHVAITMAANSLGQLPMRYSIIDREPFYSREIRKMLVENYIIFYKIDICTSEIHVIRILHNRRNWQFLIS